MRGVPKPHVVEYCHHSSIAEGVFVFCRGEAPYHACGIENKVDWLMQVTATESTSYILKLVLKCSPSNSRNSERTSRMVPRIRSYFCILVYGSGAQIFSWRDMKRRQLGIVIDSVKILQRIICKVCRCQCNCQSAWKLDAREAEHILRCHFCRPRVGVWTSTEYVCLTRLFLLVCGGDCPWLASLINTQGVDKYNNHHWLLHHAGEQGNLHTWCQSPKPFPIRQASDLSHGSIEIPLLSAPSAVHWDRVLHNQSLTSLTRLGPQLRESVHRSIPTWQKVDWSATRITG